jgi:hypothetical protein
MHENRRRSMQFQFSTRSLLLVTGVVAIVCTGLTAWARIFASDMPFLASVLYIGITIPLWMPIVFLAFVAGRKKTLGRVRPRFRTRRGCRRGPLLLGFADEMVAARHGAQPATLREVENLSCYVSNKNACATSSTLLRRSDTTPKLLRCNPLIAGSMTCHALRPRTLTATA